MQQRRKESVSVLLVDDDEVILEQLQRLFERRLERVYTALDGEAALSLFHAHPIDMVLSDVEMPNMDGVELLKAVRRLNRDIPFILSTGLHSIDVIARAIEYDITYFLPKPIDKKKLTDIIEKVALQKESALTLANSQRLLEQYKAAVDAASLVSKTDIRGNITYVNERFARLSGYTPEELYAKNHRILRHPDAPAEVYTQMWQTITAKRTWQGVIRNRTKAGDSVYVQTTIYPILDEAGEISEFISIRQDITEQVRQRLVIEQEKEFIRDILDNQESIVVVIDLNEGLINANNKLLQTFGGETLDAFKKRHRCIGTLFEAQPGLLGPTSKDANWIDMALAEPAGVHKVAMVDFSGRRRIFSLSLKPLQHPSQSRYIATFTDITELEEARLKAVLSEEAKSAFLANMSHEIRTPLNAILGFIEILFSAEKDATKRRYIETIRSSSRALLQIINDILDLSKIEKGKLLIERIVFDPHREFDAILALYDTLCREKKLFFDVRIDPLLPMQIRSDALRIKQVISNLLSNAVKFTPEGGTVQLEIGCKGNRLLFGVEDTGIGIAPENREEIFKPFAQEEKSTARRFGGTGLGLSICTQLVEMLGGTLELQSRQGEGSRFFFSLALDTPNSEAAYRASDIMAAMRIGVACEERLWQNLRYYLERMGIRSLKHFENGNRDAETCDLIFVDAEAAAKGDALACAGTVVRLLTGIEGELDVSGSKALHCPLSAYKVYDALAAMMAPEIETYGEPEPEPIRYAGRVLVVEDNATNRFFIEALLDESGLELVFANDGIEGVEAYEKGMFDLILMDENMPRMSGSDAMREIAALEVRTGCSHTPIVALTANAFAGERERFLKAGFDTYLSKPLDVKALYAVLDRYLRNA